MLGSLASHPDYSESTMAKCLSVLQKSSMAETDVVRFSDLLEKVRAHFFRGHIGLCRSAFKSFRTRRKYLG